MSITHGPMIGHVTGQTAKVWIRGDKPAEVPPPQLLFGAVHLWKAGAYLGTRFCALRDYYDFTGVVVFDGLSPSTEYEVQCETILAPAANAPPVDRLIVAPAPPVPAQPANGRFATAPPPDEARLRFVFGSCRYLFWDNAFHRDSAKGDKAFRSIGELHARKPLDFVLFVGDQIYADPLNVVQSAKTPQKFNEVYHETFGQPYFRQVTSSLPGYMILDDHEIKDNWSKDQIAEGKGGLFQVAMGAYASYQHLRNPDTPKGQLWYTFDWGAFPVFVMDTRTQRVKNPIGGEQKTILGREQLNSFLDWLHANRKAPAKIVVSSVPFVPDTKRLVDKWAEFAEERSIVLEFIRVEKIKGVAFLSGDVHNSSFSSMFCHQDGSFGLTSLVSSPFYWPYKHEQASDFYRDRTFEYMEWADKSRRTRDRIEYRYEGQGFVGDESFVLVELDANAKSVGRAQILPRKVAFDAAGEPVGHPDWPTPFLF
jgi:alkaline phosphatase D